MKTIFLLAFLPWPLLAGEMVPVEVRPHNTTGYEICLECQKEFSQLESEAFGSDVLFEFSFDLGSSEISESEKKRWLDQQELMFEMLSQLEESDPKIRLVSHTDGVGSRSVNAALAQKRAESVSQILGWDVSHVSYRLWSHLGPEWRRVEVILAVGSSDVP